MKTNVGTKFTFVRHGQSVFNSDVLDGEHDPELTELGRKQARDLTGDYDYAMISILTRAVHTYTLSSMSGCVIEYSTLCRERMLPGLNGNLLKLETGASETDGEFTIRMHMLRQVLCKKALQYDKILVVTHEGVIEYLTGTRPTSGRAILCDSLPEVPNQTPKMDLMVKYQEYSEMPFQEMAEDYLSSHVNSDPPFGKWKSTF